MVAQEVESDILIAFLHERSAPCPMCDYDLRNLASGKCPECGHALKLQIALVTPKWAAFIVGLIGLSASFGLSILGLASTVAVRFISNSYEPMSWQGYLVMGIGAIVSGACLVYWLRKSSALRRSSFFIRWAIAVCAVILPFVNLIAMMVTSP